MPVYSYKTMSALEAGCRHFAGILSNKTPLILKHDEIARAFIEPEHLPKLREVRALVGDGGRSSIWPAIQHARGVVECQVSFRGMPDYLIPSYADKGFCSDPDPVVKDRIIAWLDERMRIGQALGVAWDAIRYFNDICTDAAALRTVVPALPAIMAVVEADPEGNMSKRARKLSDTRRVTNLPMVPMMTKAAIADACAIVSSLSLIKDAPDVVSAKGEASLTLYKVASWKRLPGTDLFGVYRSVF